jgi:hypothetical protein
MHVHCKHVLIQGEAINGGLLFAGLPLPPLGGCEQKV